MAKEIRVPQLGESVTEATIGKWFKAQGDAVKVDEPLVELETDKVTVEVPAPAGGSRPRGPPRTLTPGRCRTRRTRAHVEAAADDRTPPQGCAEHRSDAHHLQRGGYEPCHGAAQSIQGSVREKAWREARFHELLRQGGDPGAEGNPPDQCRDRWR